MRGFNLPEGVTRDVSNEAGATIAIQNPECLGRISIRGGQVLGWQPNGHAQCFGFLPAQYSRLEKAFVVVCRSVGHGSPTIRLTHSNLCMVLQGSAIGGWRACKTWAASHSPV